ncbi:DUF4913 domain-containing protein [Microbacterium sp. J1-1]|uniref:DUF4913 domain-containing protein n=1 Tax=Microbacterium sp. J1-1 TaxID=2992441 RepID=UPI002114144C|nr:DUF4913 domain-containing protein [Microbacterium sp. J1-1]UUE22524.1 DUF4913 domain-containing protein [Microbacterium sp. J1-1]
MSDVLDDFREDDDPDDVDEAPDLVYGSVDEFVREYLRHMYTRPVGGGNARYRWAAEWWKSPRSGGPPRGSVARVGALAPGPCDRIEHLVGRAR